MSGERNPEIRPNPELPLFEQAHARRSDPHTSHEAARSVVNLGRTRDAIIALLKQCGPLTDGQIEERYFQLHPAFRGVNASVSSLRSRRSELVKMNLVEACGTAKTAANRDCTIWRLASRPVGETK